MVPPKLAANTVVFLATILVLGARVEYGCLLPHSSADDRQQSQGPTPTVR